MTTYRVPGCLLAALMLCVSAGDAFAQSPLSEAQTRYMGAHVFERQVEVFRRYCAADDDASRQLEVGIATFRAENPEFATALNARPTDAVFAAGVDAFDARFVEMAEAKRVSGAAAAAAAMRRAGRQPRPDALFGDDR